MALIVETVTAAFNDVGEPVPDEKTIRSISGITVREAMRILAPDADDARIEELIAALPQALSQPARDGARAAVCGRARGARPAAGRSATPSSRWRRARAIAGAVTLLERHGIIGRFNSIETPDHNRGKPDPQMIETAMDEGRRRRAAQTVMIGDTVHDMRMARAAGVAAIGVAWGYHESGRAARAPAPMWSSSASPSSIAAIDRLLGAADA